MMTIGDYYAQRYEERRAAFAAGAKPCQECGDPIESNMTGNLCRGHEADVSERREHAIDEHGKPLYERCGVCRRFVPVEDDTCDCGAIAIPLPIVPLTVSRVTATVEQWPAMICQCGRLAMREELCACGACPICCERDCLPTGEGSSCGHCGPDDPATWGE